MARGKDPILTCEDVTSQRLILSCKSLMPTCLGDYLRIYHPHYIVNGNNSSGGQQISLDRHNFHTLQPLEPCWQLTSSELRRRLKYTCCRLKNHSIRLHASILDCATLRQQPCLASDHASIEQGLEIE